MAILAGALCSLLLARARGASPLRLGAVRLRGLPLPFLAYGIQVAVFQAGLGQALPAVLWQVVSAGLLLLFLIANLRYRALGIVALGAGLNLLVVTLNGGYMPASPEDLRAAGMPQVAARLETQGSFQKTGRRDEGTVLPILGDVIRVPLPGPDRVVSPGDVLVALGIFLFLQEALVGRGTGDARDAGNPGGSRIDGWGAASPRRLSGSNPGWGPAPRTSTSPSVAPSASTATSTPTPARNA
ncbi:MAG TPA: DUF5317 domain-containing protein [Chloroflexota bacterium]|nr:DUF5317 domain-containing protein [Chloroflexota bacterium]